MKFLRRKELTPAIRLSIALTALAKKGVWGAVSGLARRHGISRQLVYIFVWSLLRLYEPDSDRPAVDHKPPKVLVDLDKLVLVLKLRGCCSIADISAVLKDLGLPNSSLGKVSQLLKKAAAGVGNELPRRTCHVILLVDEVFMAGKPILIVLDAKSHYVFRAVVAEDRSGETWQEIYEYIRSRGYTIDLVVADCADGITRSCRLADLPHHPDLRRLTVRFLVFLCRYEHQAYAAINTEYERRRVIDSARSPRVVKKRKRRYGKARDKARKAIEKYDDFAYLRQCLVEAFDLFDADGTLRSRQRAESDVMAILELMETEIGDASLVEDIEKFKKSVAGYWDYFERAKQIRDELSGELPEDVLVEVCLGWQAQKRSRAVKDYKRKKALEHKAQEHLFLAGCGEVEGIDGKIARALERLDENVRSSSPLEAINSQVRDFLNSSRSQVSQEMLNLIVYFLNHKRATRGPYKGTSRWERLTGTPEQGNYLDQILELMAEAD